MTEESAEADVRLSVDGVVFPARRRLLARHSRYFAAMFSGAFAETPRAPAEEKPIEILDIDAATMKRCLDIFSGESLRVKRSDFCSDAADALDLWLAGDMLQAAEMLRVLEFRIFPHRLTADNVVETLALAAARGRDEFLTRVVRPIAAFHLSALPKAAFLGLPPRERQTLIRLRAEWFGICNSRPPSPCSTMTTTDGDVSQPSYSAHSTASTALSAAIRSPYDRFLLIIETSTGHDFLTGAGDHGRRERGMRRQWADHLPGPHISIFPISSAAEEWDENYYDDDDDDDDAGDNSAMDDNLDLSIPATSAGNADNESSTIFGKGSEGSDAARSPPTSFPITSVAPVFELPRSIKSKSYAGWAIVKSYLIVSGGAVKNELEDEIAGDGETENEADEFESPVTDEALRIARATVVTRSVEKVSLNSMLIVDGPGEMKHRRYKHALVCDGDKDVLFVVGGVGGGKTGDSYALLSVEKCPLSSGSSWQKCASMIPVRENQENPTPLPSERVYIGHSACFKDGFIYAVGRNLVLQRYSVAADSWMILGDMNVVSTPRRVPDEDFYYPPPKLILHGSKLFLFAGKFVKFTHCFDVNRREKESVKDVLADAKSRSGGGSDLNEVVDAGLLTSPTTIATEMSGNLLIGVCEREGWNKYRREIVVIDDKFRRVNRFILRSDRNRPWTYHDMFPIYVTRMANDSNCR